MTAVLALVTLLSGQMLDGHVHRQPHGGVLAHCGPYLVEIVVHQRGERTPQQVASVDAELWLTTEDGAPVPPSNRSVRLKVVGFGGWVAIKPWGDHFEGRVGVREAFQPISFEAELRDGSRVHRARLQWTNLDDQERLDDRMRKYDNRNRK
jgi:hypothetical protein